MSNHVGSSTIYHTILPNNQALSRVRSVSLSREAKHRLTIIEYYLKGANVSLTCRFYKWLKRYDPKRLASLENHSCRPKRVRSATYDYQLVRLVRKLRQDYPRYSSKKLAVILRRDFGIYFSAATIGRIIKKFNLFFSGVVRLARQRRAGVKSWVMRKPYHLKATKPHQVIEFDMKHIYVMGTKKYAFVVVDIYGKEALAHIASKSVFLPS